MFFQSSFAFVILVLIVSLGSGSDNAFSTFSADLTAICFFITSSEPPEIYFQPSYSSYPLGFYFQTLQAANSHIIFSGTTIYFILWFYNIHLHDIMPASVACIYVSITPEWFSLLQDALSR